jgi:hypothetical protein
MFTQTSTRERITRRGTLPPLPRRAPVRSASRASGRTLAHGAAACELYRPAALGHVLTTSHEELAAGRARSRSAAPPHEPSAAATRRLAAGSCRLRRARAFRRCRIAPVATRSGRSAAGSTTCEGGGGGPTTGSAAGEVRREQLWRDEDRRAWWRRRSKQDACDGKMIEWRAGHGRRKGGRWAAVSGGGTPCPIFARGIGRPCVSITVSDRSARNSK